MINENMIYKGMYDGNLILPDVTIIKNKNIDGNITVFPSNGIIFPEASRNMEGANKLKEALKDVQELSKDKNYSIKKQDLTLKKFKEFGIQPGAEDVVKSILEKYVEICREKREKGLGFGPGIQYNYTGLSPLGVSVTLGNYGIFAATLLKAAENPEYKKKLIEKGQELLGNKQGFFVNPPAINAICESSDGYILFSNRGPTAEYDRMYHNVAAGHYTPKGLNSIPLEDLIDFQLKTEVGLSKKNLIELKFNGIALSAGYDENIIGTEKIELLAYAKLNKRLDEIAKSMGTAKHSWETRQLLAVKKKYIEQLINGTSDSKKPVGEIPELITYPKGVQPMGNPNSVSYWVPVGFANLVAWTGINPYKHN